MNQLSFVQPVDRLRQGVVIGVAFAAHRRFNSSFSQPLGVADGQILRASVRVAADNYLERPATIIVSG